MYRAIHESMVNMTDQDIFLKSVDEGLVASKELPNAHVGLILIELGHLNRITTTLGYKAGDLAVLQFAIRLQDAFSKHDRVLRIGSRRFAIVLPKLFNQGHIMLAATKVSKLAREPLDLEGGQTNVTVTMGMSVYPEHADDAEGLVQRAELALAKAQDAGAPFHLYSPGKTTEIAAIWGLENDLDLAIENGEFLMFYQPVMRIDDLSMVGAEALIRWQSPKRGLVPPDMFIPVAEETGRIDAITRASLNASLRQAAQWPLLEKPIRVNVNMTPNVLRDIEIVEVIQDSLGIWGVAPESLVLEITEEALMVDPQTTIQTLEILREMGLGIAIDDFGVGYSSLSYFKRLPADQLKIDKSFVINMINSEADERIVQTIIDLAHNFSLKVVAEGVENEETLNRLRELGCDYAQGFHLARPMPHEKLLHLLNGGTLQPGDEMDDAQVV